LQQQQQQHIENEGVLKQLHTDFEGRPVTLILKEKEFMIKRSTFICPNIGKELAPCFCRLPEGQ